jgi:LmbE family N-acetylglucosaminyl deacetylase
VISPHLDDAALSLGATIARAARSGSQVTIVTVFAGDPASTAPAGTWDRGCGFHSSGEAARVLRQEDRHAAKILGATPVWFPFNGIQYDASRNPDRLWDALQPYARDADMLLLPGYPLTHPDHAWISQSVFARAATACAVGFFAEQPYARAANPTGSLDGVRTGVESEALRWETIPAGLPERIAKGRACRAYWSQFRGWSCHVSRRFLFPEMFWIDERLAFATSS